MPALSILKQFNQQVSGNYWNHTPTAVVEDSNVKVLWDLNVYTDHHLMACHTDIVVLDKQRKSLHIIDVPSDV